MNIRPSPLSDTRHSLLPSSCTNKAANRPIRFDVRQSSDVGAVLSSVPRSRSTIEIDKWRPQKRRDDKENVHPNTQASMDAAGAQETQRGGLERLQREMIIREAKHKAKEEQLLAQIKELQAQNTELTSELERYKSLVPATGNGFAVSIQDKTFWNEPAPSEPEAATAPNPSPQKTEVRFSNGVKKETYPNGYQVIQFANGDVKQEFPEGKVVYTFAKSKTVQTNYSNGEKTYSFASGQIERLKCDGTKEITYPDGTLKQIDVSGEQRITYPDGVVHRIDVKGVQVIRYPNGNKEILLPDGRKIRNPTTRQAENRQPSRSPRPNTTLLTNPSAIDSEPRAKATENPNKNN